MVSGGVHLWAIAVWKQAVFPVLAACTVAIARQLPATGVDGHPWLLARLGSAGAIGRTAARRGFGEGVG